MARTKVIMPNMDQANIAAIVGIRIIIHCREVTRELPPSDASLYTDTIGPNWTMEKAEVLAGAMSSAIAGPSKLMTMQPKIARFLTPNLFVPTAEAMIAPVSKVQAAIVASKAAVLSRAQ